MLLDGELKGWAHTKLGWETHERRISYLREQEANNAAALRLIEDGWKENYPAPEEYFEAARRIQRRLAGAETGQAIMRVTGVIAEKLALHPAPEGIVVELSGWRTCAEPDYVWVETVFSGGGEYVLAGASDSERVIYNKLRSEGFDLESAAAAVREAARRLEPAGKN